MPERILGLLQSVWLRCFHRNCLPSFEYDKETGKGRIRLRCTNCGHVSPGWEIGGKAESC